MRVLVRALSLDAIGHTQSGPRARTREHHVVHHQPTMALVEPNIHTQPTTQPITSSAATEKVGVLLLNLGGPDTLEQVEPFLYNLFSDPEIITLPRQLGWLNGPLAWVISKSRAPSSRQGYEKVLVDGSPQTKTTLAQGRALEQALARRGVAATSYVGMRYWDPYVSDALAAIKRDGVERLVVLPLYPQFSISTSGSSLRQLEGQYYGDQQLRLMKNVVIPAWYNRKGYIDAMARLVAERLDRFDDPSKPTVFFSAHGLPKKYIETLGDPYQMQTEATVRFVMGVLAQRGYRNPHLLAYQSRVGPVEWLQPYTDEKIRELAEGGVEELVVVPVSFVSEHIETLEEIDIEYRELAEEVGIKRWERVPALGVEADFIEDLASAVTEALPKMEERPLREIDEGKPVSLRVVNDLVQLRMREEVGNDYGPVRASAPPTGRGFTPAAEVVNGRVAMAAITAASLYSLWQGTLFDEILQGRLPFEYWF